MDADRRSRPIMLRRALKRRESKEKDRFLLFIFDNSQDRT